jgi:arylsulfatase A-like enzyme
VLESVPAEYIEAYGSLYQATPELNKYREQSLLFRNIYAHAPATNASLVSILSSIYPWISYRNLTQEHPDLNIPTLSAELKQRGYRTGFFSSGDMRFQRSDEFLAHRSFDTFHDYRTLACDQQKFQSDINTWDFQDGADDQCTADSLLEWMRQDSTQPFFGMLWTVQTHYPYFYNGEEIQYTDDEKLNRYLNGLHHADAQLGRLLRDLKDRGLDESTLVVVLGDHGEAFGQHDQYAHASHIYEENLHIPLLFINPSLFHGEEAPTLGGTSDIAPSVLDILGLPAPNGWQGRSLFAPSRHKRVYFFAPWSSFRFGYREGDLKFIFDATNNTTELYDLSQDPHETNNLADQRPDDVTAGYQRLAAWVQYHDRYMKALLGYVPAHAADQALVEQTIRYHHSQAGEVFIMWGINGWYRAPESEWPPGTVPYNDKNKYAYTPMTRDGEAFVAIIKAPVGTTIDYVFHITKDSDGKDVDVWDINNEETRDYHTVILPDTVAEIYPALLLKPPVDKLAIVRQWGVPALLAAVVLSIGMIWLRRKYRNPFLDF